MTAQGNLHKMYTEFGEPIKYRLKLEDDEILVNDLLGQKISIEFNGRIEVFSSLIFPHRQLWFGGSSFFIFWNAV